MEIRSLIILAAKADSEGNFRVADRLTEKIETMSKTAGMKLGPIAREFLESLGALKIKGPAKAHTLKTPGNVIYKGYEMTPAQAAQLQKVHIDELKAGRNSINQEGSNNAIVGGPGAPAPTAPGATPGIVQQTTANPIINLYPQTKTRTTRVKGDKGDTGDQGIQGIQGIKGDPGPAGPAGKWWPGVVAGLLSGAIGAGGVALWLRSQGADDVYIRQIEDRLNNHFKANQLSARSQAGQMGNQQAAQNFIEARRGNPKFKTAQDFYYEAQRMGLPQSMMNSIAALAKAEGYQDLTRFVD